MLRTACLLALTAVCCLRTAASAGEEGLIGARYPALSPDGSTVAFEYWGDIWSAPIDGSQSARRLTDHLAWDYYPRYSPDGSEIAFVSDRSGAQEVWVMPAGGGAARQITCFSGGDMLCGWTPDGKGIVVSSQRGLWPTDLYVVPADGSAPPEQITCLDHYNAHDGVRLPDGGWLYARGTGNWWRQGYHGAAQYDLWRIFPDGHHGQVTSYNGMDEWPMLGDDGWTCYYVTDEDGTANIYALDLNSHERRQLTHCSTDGVQFPSIAPGGQAIAYEWSGALYAVPTSGGSPQRLAIPLATESKDNLVSKRSFDNAADECAVSPNGKYIVAIYQGDLWANKDPKSYDEEKKPDQDLARGWRLTSTDGARERMPAFASDNRHIAYSSDADGDYEVFVIDLADMSTKQITHNDMDDLSPQFDPANPDVLFYYSGNRTLVRTDMRSGETNTVAEGRFRGGFEHLGFSVSPDGRWVAYMDELNDWSNEVYIRDSARKEQPVNITRHPEWDGAPAWSADGKRLIFRSARDDGGVYVLDLVPEAEKYDTQFLFPEDEPGAKDKEDAKDDKETTDAGEGDEAGPDQEGNDNGEKSREADRESSKKEKESGAKKPAKVEIDFKDIHLRARRVTNQRGVGNAVISDDGKWVVFECNPDGTGMQIWSVKAEGGEANRIQGGGWASPTFAAGGKRIFYRDGGTVRYMKFADGKNRGIETVDLKGEFTLDKRGRWRQMFREGWRTLKEQFYDPAMHGSDWQGVYAKYAPLIDRIGTPEEFGLVFSEVLGELNASHLGIGMAENSFTTSGRTTCHLGLEFDAAFSGPGLRVSHITYRGPADQPGVDLKEGDVLLQVEGQAVGKGLAYLQLIDDRQGVPTTLTFTPRDPFAGGENRKVVLKPITYGDYQNLLYREWELDNEHMIDRLSGGRIGYVHIRSMSHRELDKFQREFFSEVFDKDALIVDVRFNPGGFIHEELFDLLDKNPFGFAGHRDAVPVLQPARAFLKPKALVINARCGSDSEIFPAGWRTLNLGPIIGIETAGAVIGTNGFTLVDGTWVRLPVEGWWDINQRNLEKSGTKPDVYMDVTPDELAAGKDAQLAKAVEVLLAELKRQGAAQGAEAVYPVP